MTKTEKIRAYLLEVNDFFILLGATYRVIKVTSTETLFIAPRQEDRGYNRKQSIGAKSREFILLICPPRLPANYSFIYN